MNIWTNLCRPHLRSEQFYISVQNKQNCFPNSSLQIYFFNWLKNNQAHFSDETPKHVLCPNPTCSCSQIGDAVPRVSKRTCSKSLGRIPPHWCCIRSLTLKPKVMSKLNSLIFKSKLSKNRSFYFKTAVMQELEILCR